MMKGRKRTTVKDWLLVLVLLLDEVAALVLVLLALWFFKIEIPLPVMIAIVLLLGVFAFATHKLIIPSFHKKKATGSEAMIGQDCQVTEPLAPVGVVRIEGEYWRARSVGGDIAAGEDVEIVRLYRLTVEVKLKRGG